MLSSVVGHSVLRYWLGCSSCLVVKIFHIFTVLYLVLLSVIENVVLKSPNIIVELSISS